MLVSVLFGMKMLDLFAGKKMLYTDI